MKSLLNKSARTALVLLVLLAAGAAPLRAQINPYLSPFSGKWESGTNWSLGAPGSGQSIYITNSGTKTVTIDATTSVSFSNTMSINDLTLFGTTNTSTNILALANAGTGTPLQIASTVFIGSGFSPGLLTITNSAVQIGSTVLLNRGGITLNSGLLSATNGSFIIGNTPNGPGTLTVNGGTAFFGPVNIANFTSDTGFWIINGGTNICRSSVTVANYANGTLTVNGGKLFVTNTGAGTIGLAGNVTNSLGTLTMTNGEVDANFLQVGILGQGILNLNGGLLTASSNMVLGVSSGSSGAALISGGVLAVTNPAHNATFEVRRGSFTNLGGVFQVDNVLVTNGGTMNLLTSNNFAIGSAIGTSNTAIISGGSTVSIPNAAFGAGNDGTTNNGSGAGSITVSNATLIASTINLGSTAGGSGNLILQSNASVFVNGNMNVVGTSSGSTSSVSVVGGSLTASNGLIQIGMTGAGLMTISSGGNVTAQTVKLGSSVPGASGTLTMSNNSHLRINSVLSVNSDTSFDLPGINVVVDGTDSTLNVGDDNPGTMRLTSPSASQNWANINIGYNATGTYLQSAGQTVATQSVTVGNCVTNGPGAAGLVTLSGGAFYVTNSTHTAVLVVRNGTFVLGSGATLVADNLIITNACARFQNNGGTLTILHTNLDASLDADGDGVSNGAEAAEGTDPFNPASYFHIVSAKRSGNNASLTWTTVGGKFYYYVQACTNRTRLAGSNFVDVSPPLGPFAGTGDGTTSFTVPNGAANSAVFYRIRLGP